MIKIDSQVKGLAELDRFLATLPEEIQRKMLGSSLRVAAKPILDQAELNVLTLFGSSRRSSGVLFSHITRSRTKQTGYAARVNILLKRKRGGNPKQKPAAVINGVRKPYGDDPFYGRFLEFGRGSGVTRTGRQIAPMEAKPWLRPAAIAKQHASGPEMNKALQKRVAAWCKANGVRFESSV